MKTIKYFAMLAAVAATALTSCNDAKFEPIENGIYIEQASTITGFAQQIQSKTVAGENVSVPVTIRLMRPAEETIRVFIAADLQTLNEYNEAYGKNYQMLPEAYYTMKTEVTIAAGGTSANTDLVIPDGIPDGNFAIALRIAKVEGNISPAGNGNKIIYLLKSSNRQTAVKLKPYPNAKAGCLKTSLDMTLPQWTVEYWVNFEDNGAAGATKMAAAWDSAAAGTRPAESGGPGWRFYVFAREAQPIAGLSGMTFLFYPNGGEDKGPSMQFKFRGENIPSQLGSNLGGFLWVGNEWVHMAITYDSSTNIMKYYINGVEGTFSNNATEYDEIDTNPILWSSMTLGSVGSSAAHACENNLCMQMAQVRLWNRVLTDSDIADNMGSALAGDEAGLVGYWKLNEPAGSTTFKDSCLNGTPHDLTGSANGGVTAVVDFSNPNATE